MESNIKASFIPKDAGSLGVKKPSYGESGLMDIIVLLAVVVMVASVALGAGVFVYERYLEASLSSKKEQLTRAQGAFEPNLITELTRLDDRLKAAQEVLDRHVAPTIFFALLEQLTLETVSFKDLTYDGTQGEVVKVDMRGIAQSVNSIALQADTFGKHPAISSPIFSNIGRDREGVRFDVTATINPSALRYKNTVAPVSEDTSGFGDVGAQPPPEGSSVPLFAP